MKISFERMLSSYSALEDLFDANPTITAGLHNFSTVYTPFKATVATIRGLQQQQIGATSTDATKKKIDARRSVIFQAETLLIALKAHFIMADDHSHDAIIGLGVARLKGSADTNFVSDCRNILALATTVAADLVNYNIDAAFLTNYAASITVFEAIIPKPRMTLVDRAAFTAALETNFETAKTLLDKISALVDVLKYSNPTFYQRFLGAKKVTNLNTRLTAFRMSIKSTDGVAQTGCTVQFLRQATGETIIYKTNKSGTLVRQNMVDGVYEITITKNDYAPLSGKIVLIQGETYILEVTVDVTAKVFKDGRNPKTGEAI
jgi:hypothetical protein